MDACHGRCCGGHGRHQVHRLVQQCGLAAGLIVGIEFDVIDLALIAYHHGFEAEPAIDVDRPDTIRIVGRRDIEHARDATLINLAA